MSAVHSPAPSASAAAPPGSRARVRKQRQLRVAAEQPPSSSRSPASSSAHPTRFVGRLPRDHDADGRERDSCARSASVLADESTGAYEASVSRTNSERTGRAPTVSTAPAQQRGDHREAPDAASSRSLPQPQRDVLGRHGLATDADEVGCAAPPGRPARAAALRSSRASAARRSGGGRSAGRRSAGRARAPAGTAQPRRASRPRSRGSSRPRTTRTAPGTRARSRRTRPRAAAESAVDERARTIRSISYSR